MKLIVIDGNIGSGKTTLIQALQQHLKNVYIVTENVDEWKKSGLLDKYYDNPKEMAFRFQMKVAMDHSKTIKNMISTYGNDITIISERSTYSCYHIFTRMLKNINYMNDMEEEIHKELCLECGYKPDIYIYLKTNIHHLLQRIERRNRENNIPKKYLEDLDKQYEMMKKQCNKDNIKYIEINSNKTPKDVLDEYLYHFFS